MVVRASSAPGAAAVGTLSVAGPVGRFTPERRAAFVAELRAASAELSGLWPLRSPLATAAADQPAANGRQPVGALAHAS